jgi:hypothetical protein
MSANSPPAAVTVSVAPSDVQSNWWSWLQSMAAAINQLAAWANRPQLAPLTVDTLPAGVLPGLDCHHRGGRVGWRHYPGAVLV